MTALLLSEIGRQTIVVLLELPYQAGFPSAVVVPISPVASASEAAADNAAL